MKGWKLPGSELMHFSFPQWDLDRVRLASLSLYVSEGHRNVRYGQGNHPSSLNLTKKHMLDLISVLEEKENTSASGELLSFPIQTCPLSPQRWPSHWVI